MNGESFSQIAQALLSLFKLGSIKNLLYVHCVRLQKKTKTTFLQCLDPNANEKFRKSETSPSLAEGIIDILHRFWVKRQINYRGFPATDSPRDY